MASRKVTFQQSLLIFVLATYLACVQCERVKKKIYDDLQGDQACFKRFNGTHEIGCTSKFWGNIGTLHVVLNKTDMDWLVNHGPHHPYVIAIYPETFSEALLSEAQKSGKVNGVVVMVPEDYEPDISLPNGFSAEYKCPSEQFGLYNESSNPDYSGYCSKNPWNPSGSALLYTNWDFPIFFIDNGTDVDNIKNCFMQFNQPIEGEPRSWPLCSIDLHSNMFGTTNTEVCMRRRLLSSYINPVNFCDPLYDYNVWGTVKPMNKSEDLSPKSIIIVAARMDATTMFDNISPGAESAISGLVTLFSTAEALYRHRDEFMESRNDKNILFVLYQGESWDYIGSSRMVYDMERGVFPFSKLVNEMPQINFTHIDSFIEISQVGKMSADKMLYLHTDPISNQDNDIKDDTDNLVKLFSTISNITGKINLKRTDPEMPLPPSSMQSFLKRVNISGLVIADHENEYKNKYYQSAFDNSMNINEEDITDVSSFLATSLYTMLTGDAGAGIQADRTLTENLIECYAKNVSCEMFSDFRNLIDKSFFNDKPAKMYVSVKKGEELRTYITTYIFATLMGEKILNATESECEWKNSYQVDLYYYFATVDNGSCYKTTVRKTEAMSPAFMIPNYDWQSGEYSTWAESGWALTKAKLFLRPSLLEEISLVCGGVVSVILSFTVVYFMNARSDILFGLPTPPAAC